MDSYMVSPGNAWEPESFDGKYGGKSDAHRDKYFDKTDEGHFKLKDGYEQRSLGGSGDSLGAEMTYTTEWDDDDDRKQEYYGIFKKAEPKSNDDSTPAPAEEPAPAPKPAEKTAPVEYTSQMQQAKERVNTYKNDMASGASTDSIFSSTKPNEAAQSFLDNKKYQFNAQ